MSQRMPDEPTMRSLLMGIYLPIVIFAIGEGAVMPFIVIGAQDRGASEGTAGAVFALIGISALAFAVPAGALIARIGERGAAVVAVVLVGVGLLGALVSSGVAAYATGIFVMGIAWSVWRLVRFSYLAGAVRTSRRGRALSMMGGAQRIGVFVGPFIAAVIVAAGGIGGAFVFAVAASVVALAVFVSVRLVGDGDAPDGGRPTMRSLWGQHGPELRRAGLGSVILMALRAARSVVIPLWGIHLGLDPAAVAVIFGVSSGVDALLFYPAGSIMDRFGRKWAGVPSLVLLSISFILIPVTGSFAALMTLGVVLGIANGLSAGYIATLGSDLAPSVGRAEFLGIWQMIANVGFTSGPLALGGLAAVSSLSVAAPALGVVGLLGAAYIASAVPETLVRSAP
jgi:MFS family permease